MSQPAALRLADAHRIDERNDLRRNFNVSNAAFALPLPENIKGLFEVKLSWQQGGQTYFHEQKEFFN